VGDVQGLLAVETACSKSAGTSYDDFQENCLLLSGANAKTPRVMPPVNKKTLIALTSQKYLPEQN
jgi:hypothetical protein